MSAVLELIQPQFEKRFAYEDRKRAASVQHTPRQNHLIAALPAGDYERLLPDLEPIQLPLGWAVHRSGDSDKYLYFPTAGIVSKFYVTENGASAGFAVTGREGVIGVASILSSERSRTFSIVVGAGYAYRIATELMTNECDRHRSPNHMLLRYTQALMTQIAQTAACNRHHSVDQQISRWILQCLDRLPGNELPMTHEVIASMVGVRREGVTVAAGKLQDEGLIHCGRGRIMVLNRPKLEARACECYAVVKREYARLFPAMTATQGRHPRTEQCRPPGL